MTNPPPVGSWFVCELYHAEAHIAVTPGQFEGHDGSTYFESWCLCDSNFSSNHANFRRAKKTDKRCRDCERIAKRIAKAIGYVPGGSG